MQHTLLETLTQLLDNRVSIANNHIYLNFSKVFGGVPQQELLNRLISYGIALECNQNLYPDRKDWFI